MKYTPKPKTARRLVIALVVVLVALVIGGPAAKAESVSSDDSTNYDACYEQVEVIEFMYERQLYRTQFEFQKQTHEKFRDYSGEWGPWSEPIWWSSIKTSFLDVEVLEGPYYHAGDPDGDWYREYWFAKNGNSTQVPNGKETTDWLSGPPEGEGWVQINTRSYMVNGQQIPCDSQPDTKVVYGDWVDGEWDCDDTEVTQTRTKTTTKYILVNYVWVPGEPVVETESQTRPLTETELATCATTTTTTTVAVTTPPTTTVAPVVTTTTVAPVVTTTVKPYTCPSGTTWVDANGDGVKTANECKSLPATGSNSTIITVLAAIAIIAIGWVLVWSARRRPVPTI